MCITARLTYTFALVTFSSVIAHAITIASDGAVDVNAQWEAGKASTWYIEEQRDGDDFIEKGIRQENDSLIQTGLLIYNWGFSKQASDGSFPGTGDAFHSTSMFVEAVSRSMLLLRNYQPVTYTKDYSSVVNGMVAKLASACNWLTDPTVAANGQKYDAPYTHRRYILAAALNQTAALTNNTSLAAAATTYDSNGLALQWTSGVNPELGGYDVEYQCTGVRYALNFLSVCQDNAVRAANISMIQNALFWESGRISVTGALDSSGSTRVGVEKNRDGSTKQPTMSDIACAFERAYAVTGQQLQAVNAARLRQSYFYGCNQDVASSGAIGSNSSYDTGSSSSYQLGVQRYGTEWICEGIRREDDSMIRLGIKILNWGVKKQQSDGSFKGTSSSFYNTAQFVEGLVRAANAINSYKPVTYTLDSTYYGSTYTSFKSSAYKAAKWLTKSDVASSGWKSDQPYASHRWLMADVLAGTGALCADSGLVSASTNYAQNGLSMQLSSGVNPEKGTYDVNYQALGIVYAGRYLQYYPGSSLASATKTMISKGLGWLETRVNLQGDVNTGTSTGPSYEPIKAAFYGGYRLLGLQHLSIYFERIDENH